MSTLVRILSPICMVVTLVRDFVVLFVFNVENQRDVGTKPGTTSS